MALQRRPTIIDVARKAGVSKSTVSLVLQNSPSVRDATRKQVRAAMIELGYVYNRAAAKMRTTNAGLVGLIINDLRNPFFTEFATSVQMALSEKGYATVIANTDENPELQAQMVETMIEHGVSAFVISPTYGEVAATFDIIAGSGRPTIQVLRKVDPRTDLFPFAAPDYFEGGRIATRHLLDQGARQIAFVGGLEGRDITTERMAGYLEVLQDAGLAPRILTGQASRQFGREAAFRLSQEQPDCDAVVCFNDLVALGMISGCHEHNIPIGRNFRVVGFDDIEDAAVSWPGLTTVRCDIVRFGQTTAETVSNWLEKDIKPLPETHSPVELVVRASSSSS